MPWTIFPRKCDVLSENWSLCLDQSELETVRKNKAGGSAGSPFLQQFGVQDQRKVRWDLEQYGEDPDPLGLSGLDDLYLGTCCWGLPLLPRRPEKLPGWFLNSVFKHLLTHGTCCGQASGDRRITLSGGTEESWHEVFFPTGKTRWHDVIRDSHFDSHGPV